MFPDVLWFCFCADFNIMAEDEHEHLNSFFHCGIKLVSCSILGEENKGHGNDCQSGYSWSACICLQQTWWYVIVIFIWVILLVFAECSSFKCILNLYKSWNKIEADLFSWKAIFFFWTMWGWDTLNELGQNHWLLILKTILILF